MKDDLDSSSETPSSALLEDSVSSEESASSQNVTQDSPSSQNLHSSDSSSTISPIRKKTSNSLNCNKTLNKMSDNLNYFADFSGLFEVKLLHSFYFSSTCFSDHLGCPSNLQTTFSANFVVIAAVMKA